MHVIASGIVPSGNLQDEKVTAGRHVAMPREISEVAGQ